jgi:hypothetical protein
LDDAITAIKQALAAPVGHRDGHWCVDLTCKKCYSADFRLKHTTPPAQRQWVGLSEDQRQQVRNICVIDIPAHVFYAIEAKLKENT